MEDPIILEGRLRALARSFPSLDAVNLSELFESRPLFMRSVPHDLRGGLSQEILAGVEANSEPPRGGTVPRKKLEGRFKQFQEVDWLSLLSESSASSQQGQVGAASDPRRRSCKSSTGVVSGAIGERSLLAVRLWKVRASPWVSLRWEFSRIPTGPLVPTGVESGDSSIGASQLYELDPIEFLFLYKEGRRGAAPGPSGMTSDHLFLVFESDAESALFIQVR